MEAKLFENSSDKRMGAAGCAVDSVLQFLARKWMSHIVWTLARKEVMRFGALRRALPGPISSRVLSSRLKELESYGLVLRHDAGKLPLHIEYKLTEAGRRLDAVLRRHEKLTGALKKDRQRMATTVRARR